jgi:hypothetical protein
MKTNNVAGHSQNVTNLNVLVSLIPSYGDAYNPSVQSLALTELKALYAQGVEVNNDVSAAEVALKNAIAARVGLFDGFDDVVTKTINALKISGASSQTLDQAQVFVRSLRGKRATDKLSAEEIASEKEKGNEVKQVTLHNASFDSKIDNFGKYTLFLASTSEYKPNETDLSNDGLSAKLADYKAKNNDVITADAALSAARQKRNEVLYADNTGLVAVAQAVKLYVKSVFGATSPQYKQISSISFTSLK